MIDQLLEATKNNGGCTYDVHISRVVTPSGWLFPAYPDNTMIIPAEICSQQDIHRYIDTYRNLFSSDVYLGLRNSPRNAIYFDIVMEIADKQDALNHISVIHQTSVRNIESMYCGKTGEEVFLV